MIDLPVRRAQNRPRPRSRHLVRACLGLGLVGVLVAGACSQDAGVASVLVVSTVQVDPPAGSVVLGHTLQLTAIPKTEGGLPLPSRDVAWSSTDNTIATVTTDGVVTGHAIGGPVRIRATVDGVIGETQITVLPVPVDHILVTPGTKTVLVNQQAQLTATAYDSDGVALTGRTFFWASDATGIAGVTSTGLVVGIAPGGPVTITASADGKTGSAIVTVSGRPATRLGFGQQPSQAIAGIALTPAVQVLVQDDLLGTVPGATNSVTIALTGNTGGATLTGTKTVAAVNGVATFTNLVVDRAGTGYTLMASAQGLTSAVSAPFSVVAGAANRLALTTGPPATARNGIAFTTHPEIQIVDAGGNPVPGAGVVVTASIASGNGKLGGTVAVPTDASGAATFANLSLTGPVGAYTIAFSAPGIAPVTSGTITLTAGLPATLSITTQPSGTAQSGVTLARQPAVQVLDGAGNPVLQSGVDVTVSIASGPAGGTLGGTLVASTGATGVAAFSGLVLTGPSGSYVLGFRSGQLPVTTSTPIALGAGAGTSLAVTTQPSAQASNAAPFAQQPVIQLRDAANNPVAQSGVSITASIQSGGGSLLGTTVVATDASGKATFANLAISGLVGVRTLQFSSPGYVAVASSPVTLGAGAAFKLGVAVQPSAAAQNGVAFPQQPVVQVQDESGNPVAQAGTSVTASLGTGPAGGGVGGTMVATTNAGGAAAFTNLNVAGPAGAYTLAFTATGLTGATSNTVSLGAGTPSALALPVQPSSTAFNGAVFAQQPVVQLVDGAGNPSNQAGVAVSVAISGSTGTLGGTATVNTDASGRAAFAGLSITGTAGSYTLAFSAPSLTGVTSSPIVLAAGAAGTLTIATQPSATAVNGAVFAQQPVIQLVDGSGNPAPQAGVAVTAALVSVSGGVLGGTATVNTDAAGRATFAGLSITGKAGSYTLVFSAPSMNGVTSTPIAITPGPPALLAITTPPSSTVANAATFPQQPVLQVTDASGNAVSGAVVTVAIAVGGGTLGGTSTVSSDANGVAAFAGLSITGLVGARTLTFSTPGAPPVSSGTITVTAGAPSLLTITGQPAPSAQSGVVFTQQPSVQVADISGNPVGGAVVTVSIATGGGSLGGSATATASGTGVAVFSGLSISGIIGAHTLGFTAGAASPVTSNKIDLLAGPATQIRIVQQPSTNAHRGTPFPQQPIVVLLDAAGNGVPNASVKATLNNPPLATGKLAGTVTIVTDAVGVATFLNLEINKAFFLPYTITFTSGGLSITSNGITVN